MRVKMLSKQMKKNSLYNFMVMNLLNILWRAEYKIVL